MSQNSQTPFLKLPVELRLEIYQLVLRRFRFPRYTRHISSPPIIQVCRVIRDESVPIYDKRLQRVLESTMAAEEKAAVAYRSFKEDGSRASAMQRIVLDQQVHATTEHSDRMWRLVQKKRLALEREGFLLAVPSLHFW